jgi:hypothetical protein
MFEQRLLHMYQAWQQGHDDYARNWQRFVNLAAGWLGETPDNMLRTLEKYKWFKQ